MDSFTEYITNYWRKASNIQAASAMKLHVETIAIFNTFAENLVSQAWQQGLPVPTPEQVIAEWLKTHAPTHYVATPFGTDQPQIISPGTQSTATLRQDILDILAKHGL